MYAMRMRGKGFLTAALGVTLLALVAAVVYSAVNIATRPPASAAAGSIFVANEGTRYTTESPAPAGYTSTATLVAAFDNGGGLALADSDLVKVTVKDPGYDALTNVTATSLAVGTPGSGSQVFTATPGLSSIIFLTGKAAAGELISGPNSTIKVVSGGVDLVETGSVSVLTRFGGSATDDPWISVINNSAAVPFTVSSVEYVTSAVDTMPIVVRSDLELTGVIITGYETGLSTGVFEGYVRMVNSQGPAAPDTGPGSANAGSMRTTGFPGLPVILSFQDSDTVNHQIAATTTSDDLEPASGPPAGQIFIANEGTKLTNEAPAPDGYTATGEVVATYDDGGGLALADSDLVKVIVKDAGANILTSVSATSIAVGDPVSGSSTFTALVGNSDTIYITGQAGTLIAGDNSDIKVMSEGVDLIGSGVLSIVGRFSGDGVNDPWITVLHNFANVPFTIDSVNYQTSEVDQVPGGITVTSDLDSTGITLQADETDLGSGVFYGYVRLVDGSSASADSTGAGPANAGAIRTAAGPVTLSFTDSEGGAWQTTVSVTTADLPAPDAGEIFVANEWSKLTDETPAPTGYTATGAIYATYDDDERLIQTNSDFIKIIVKDASSNVLSEVSATSVEVEIPGSGTNAFTATPGDMQVIFLTGKGAAEQPIAGGDDTIQVFSGGVDLVASGAVSIVARFDGTPVNDPWIMVVNNFAAVPFTVDEVRYQTSLIDQVVGGVTVKSDLEPGGVVIEAYETGINSGVFNGYLRLVPSTSFTAGSTGPGDANAGQVRVSSGPVTFEFEDGSGAVRQTSVIIDVSPPVPSVTAPAPGSATQNRRPTFSGSISDTSSGLDISGIAVVFDGANDAANVAPVIDISNSVFSGAAIQLNVSTSGAVDGDSGFSFSQAPPFDIPSVLFTPDHIVDWVIKAGDLAGNIGLSDIDPVTNGVQLPTVKIDQVIPTFSTKVIDNKTGLAWNGSGEVIARDSIRVAFNDQLMNVDASDFLIQLDSGPTLEPISVTLVNNPTAFPSMGVVYLQLADDLAASETPIVSLQDTIQDVASNSTATGSVAVADGIKPTLTVITSGGSGSGSGDEGPGGLTDSQMTIQVVSDEPLNSAPTVSVRPVGGLIELNPTVLSSGPNQWEAAYSAPVSATTGDRAVVVVGSDPSANQTTVGNANTRAFTLDLELQAPVFDVSPSSGGVVTSATPDIAIDFTVNGEVSSVSVDESAILLDGATGKLEFISNAGGKTPVFRPSDPLPAGTYTVTVPVGAAVDAAGHANAIPFETTFEVEATDEVTISMSPEEVSLRADETATITVMVADLDGAVPDTVQINLQHDDSVVSLVNPSCAGIFAGGSVSEVQRDQTDTGSWFVCTKPGGASGQSGVVATFELRRAGDGNPVVEFGTAGGTGSAFFEAGELIAAVSTDTLQVLPGARVTGHVTIQGVSDEAAFSLIAPEVTLTPVSGDAPGPVIIPVEADGSFVFEAVYDGVYDLTLDAPGTLGRHMTGLTVGTDDIALQSVELRGGIVNGDDELVNGADVSAVTGSFGSGPGELTGRLNADGNIVDFDGDGYVTGFDISIVMSNVGETRLQEWTDPAQSP
jgi:hypothetical protein